MKRVAAALVLVVLGVAYLLAGRDRESASVRRIESEVRQTQVTTERTVERDRRVRPGGGDPRREN